MGWLDSLWSSEKKSDPLGKLDPQLKAFLEKESPVKYELSTESASKRAPSPDSSQSPTQQSHPETPVPQQPKVPPQSLFPDGRYAHLWSTYRPLSDIETESKTDNEKLQDVLDGYKERKKRIAKAAIENCANEQWEWRDCMTEGGIRAKTTMCNKEVRRFERCYGVMNDFRRPGDVDEDIQVHAYDIYQAMLKQEAAMAAARKAGEPAPKFPPLIPRRTDEEEAEYVSTLPEEDQEKFRRQLDLAGSDEKRAQLLALHKALEREKMELSRGVEGWRRNKEKGRSEGGGGSGGGGVMDQVMGLWGKKGGNGDGGGDDGEGKK
ncbi:hypothetical protein MKZ38_001769 [Zalerion maritima]|uniref:Uncharacterized protein n=1 Tax=Zalerion maritima TaxID=339359 RepID=A0AAD5RXF9_9PEZI|nr:hypothetical protein MKZ38_001769 [Zalerion maritima]